MDGILALFITASTQYGLPPKLLESVCFVETRHNPNAIHHNDGRTDSYGICQIKLEAAQTVGFKGTSQSLMVPRVNIKYAAKLLAHQIKRYHGDIKKAIIAYNRGSAKLLTSTKYSDRVISQWRLANE
jgi:soluble lytic murein transglycosylase-like protein